MKKERSRLIAMWKLSSAVPFPKNGLGAATSSMRGMVIYQADMREFIQGVNLFYQGVLMEGRGGLEEGIDYENPDLIIRALQSWVKCRQQHDWDENIPTFRSFLAATQKENQ
jgi:hypothetical protein